MTLALLLRLLLVVLVLLLRLRLLLPPLLIKEEGNKPYLGHGRAPRDAVVQSWPPFKGQVRASCVGVAQMFIFCAIAPCTARPACCCRQGVKMRLLALKWLDHADAVEQFASR